MPGMDGFGFLEKYGETYLSKHPDTRLYILTALYAGNFIYKTLKYKSLTNYYGEGYRYSQTIENAGY